MPHRPFPLRCAVAALASFLLAASATRAQEPAFYWRTDLEQALGESRAARKPIWVQFTGSWCHFCRRMEAEVFPWEPVARIARERFRTVLVHAEHREDLMAHFGVAKLPTTILLDPDGREIARVQGYRAPADFLGFLQATEARIEPPAAPADPAVGPTPGLEGKCPVSLVEQNTLTEGRPDLTAVYDGREYRFRDPAARERFLANPIPYLPAQRGLCPVTLLDQDTESAGDSKFGVYYRDRLYLCRDEPSRQTFARDPDRYARTELASGGYCPHCRTTEGKLVRGESQFSVIHSGRRYEFPDDTHRQAFRNDPERFVR